MPPVSENEMKWFEERLRNQVSGANLFNIRSGSDAPWEIVIAHIIALEKRIVELENDRGKSEWSGT